MTQSTSKRLRCFSQRDFLVALLFLLSQAGNNFGQSFQPEEFVLGDFNFPRPASWEWLRTYAKPPTIGLKVVDPQTAASARITMVHYEPAAGLGKPAAALKRWRDQFLPQPKPDFSTNETFVGSRKVIYVKIIGTHKGDKPEDNPRPDSMLFGAIIADDKGNVIIKIVGPGEVVAKTEDDCRKMIGDALKNHLALQE